VSSAELTLPEIHDEVVAVLRAAGYDSVDKVLSADPGQLAELPGFDAETVDAVLAAAREQQAVQMAEQAAEPADADAAVDQPVGEAEGVATESAASTGDEER
jgi:hypothetical protein